MRFFRPATVGGFGVVAGAGKLAGLDVPALLDAFGILYGQTSGTLQAHLEGSMVLGLQVGFNARAGLNAVDLAAAGLTGPHDVLVGHYGFYQLFEPESDIERGGRSSGNVADHAALAQTLPQRPADPRGGRRRASGPEGARFRAEEVESIHGWMTPLTFRLVGRPDIPDAGAELRAALHPVRDGDRVHPRGSRSRSVRGPGTHRSGDPRARGANPHRAGAEPDLNALWPQRFAIRLKDGWTWDHVVEKAIGHPDNPLRARRAAREIPPLLGARAAAARGPRMR